MKNVAFILIGLILLVGCDPRPRPWTMAKAPENAPPNYKQGWTEGCESGLTTYSNAMYKMAYSFKQDVALMVKDELYSKAWNDAFNYCRGFINRFLLDGFWSQEGFGDGNMRGRKILETRGLGLTIFQGINTPGWKTRTFNNNIQGFNSFVMGAGGDWLGRNEADTPDWLGRTGEYKNRFQ